MFENMLKGSRAYSRLLKSDDSLLYTTGMADGLKPVIVSRLCRDKGKKGFIICDNEIKAREFYNSLSFTEENVYLYPAKDMVFYAADVKSAEIVKNRFEVLDKIFKNEADFIVVSAETLLEKIIKPDVLKKRIINLSEADEIDVAQLEKELIFMGYERNPQAEGAGQFAVRGGIIDIFAPNNTHPVRIELWGDEIDTIRTIDRFSQRSLEQIKSVSIFPFRDCVYGEKELNRAVNIIEKENKEIAERLREEKSFGGVERFINYFYDETAALFDYIDENSIIFYNEISKIRSELNIVYEEFIENVSERHLRGKALGRESGLLYTPDSIFAMGEKFKRVELNEFYDLGDGKSIDFHSKNTAGYGRNIEELIKNVKYYYNKNFLIILFAGSSQFIRNIIEVFTEEGYGCQSGKAAKKGVINIYKGGLPSFIDDEVQAVLLNEGGNAVRKHKRRRKNSENTSAIYSVTDLKPGDYVVHENHGIGIYRGIEQVENEGVIKDYICLEYKDGGKIYVSVNQMDMVQKYIGTEAGKLKLNSLGGTEWAKAKAKASAAVKKLAFDLVELYGKRETVRGVKYSADTVWQKEFEEEFEYEETDDQLQAVEDIKKDMESGKVMDRLICGDVGYGKTEVALRAAFKAINEGRQAAFLVPTTILANQHYENIIERFKNYPINIEMLSRFKTKQQQGKTIEGLKSGRVDFVVGTHRLLSKDVEFKNLGLVIVDEEQRFGVGHKEKLKYLTENVDVLTLSATPIPRTLHMSLSGIRDMSVLNEPPSDRLPVQTYVMEYEDNTVRTAVMRELRRGGQVYFLHNRVQTIEKRAEQLERLVPEAKIGIGHGQMSERQLENVLKDFLDKKINVLVCTTIIETGMDISNVNTIIIENADFMGLSQLYQLRGRVGRTNRQAYAYLMHRKNKIPNEISEKRLKTIKEFTEFGSGFKIAVRDLEIRGAGNLLGANQHGHMEQIGYDMYCKILNDSIRELKGEPVKEQFETKVDINVNAFIPNTYIDDESQKLEMYKKISLICSDDDYKDTADELVDRFGEYPKAVENLMNISLIKQKAHRAMITGITEKSDSIVFSFHKNAKPDEEKLFKLIKEEKGRVQLTTQSSGVYITLKTDVRGTPVLAIADNFLNRLIS